MGALNSFLNSLMKTRYGKFKDSSWETCCKIHLELIEGLWFSDFLLNQQRSYPCREATAESFSTLILLASNFQSAHLQFLLNLISLI